MLVNKACKCYTQGAEEGIAGRNARGTQRRAGRARGKDHCEKKAKKTDKNFDKIVSINILISYIIKLCTFCLKIFLSAKR